MSQEKNIQDIFTRLQDKSSPVNPDLWQTIQHGAGLGTTTGLVVKSGMSIISKLFIAAGITAAVVGIVYVAMPGDAAQKSTATSESVTNSKAQVITENSVEDNSISTSEEEMSAAKGSTQPESVVESEDKSPAVSENLPPVTNPDSATTENVGDSENNAENSDKETISEDTENADTSDSFDLEVSILSHQEEEDPLDWFFTVEGPDAANYFWTFTDGYKVHGKRVRHRFMTDGTYGVCVSVTNIEGQNADKCIDVEALRKIKLVIPNVFSPGTSPGVNDLFDIDKFQSENILAYRLLIYDASGALVFESKEGRQSWDGNNRFGEPMPVGNYVCVVEASGYAGQKTKAQQTLTLKR